MAVIIAATRAWKLFALFPSERGTPLDGGNMVCRYFRPALRKAGLPTIRFHDLRHSFASLLIAQGEHPKLISEQLGHASRSPSTVTGTSWTSVR